MGSCYSTLYVDGPGDYGFSALVQHHGLGYHYNYTRPQELPGDALLPWYWSVELVCPSGEYNSEVRTFSVEPGSRPAYRLFFPGVVWVD